MQGHRASSTVRGRPCPVAGRSLRPSLASAHSMPAALRHPACACRQGRLPGHGQPLTDGVRTRGAIDNAGASCVINGSGPPVPRRRTFAAAIPGLRSLHAGRAPASCLRLPPRPAPGARATPHGWCAAEGNTTIAASSAQTTEPVGGRAQTPVHRDWTSRRTTPMEVASSRSAGGEPVPPIGGTGGSSRVAVTRACYWRGCGASTNWTASAITWPLVPAVPIVTRVAPAGRENRPSAR